MEGNCGAANLGGVQGIVDRMKAQLEEATGRSFHALEAVSFTTEEFSNGVEYCIEAKEPAAAATTSGGREDRFVQLWVAELPGGEVRLKSYEFKDWQKRWKLDGEPADEGPKGSEHYSSVQEMIDKVKPQLESHLGFQFVSLVALPFRGDLIAHRIYTLKASGKTATGHERIIFLRLFYQANGELEFQDSYSFAAQVRHLCIFPPGHAE